MKRIIKLTGEKDEWLAIDFEEIEKFGKFRGYTFYKINEDGYGGFTFNRHEIPTTSLIYARELNNYDESKFEKELKNL